MNLEQANDDNAELKVLCMIEDDTWRLLLGAGSYPAFLRECFDQEGEAFPVQLDFDDLEIFMQKRRAPYGKKPSTLGDMELSARGHAVVHLAHWLASAIASGFRDDLLASPSTRGECA